MSIKFLCPKCGSKNLGNGYSAGSDGEAYRDDDLTACLNCAFQADTSEFEHPTEVPFKYYSVNRGESFK